MNHLMSFGANSPIRVPYVCSEMYDGLHFFSYLHRKGWKLEKLANGNLGDKTSQDAASFLQAWLYFGLLFHVLGPVDVSFTPYDFIEDTQNGQSVISTRKLPEYIIRWNEWEQQRTAEQRRERHGVIKPSLTILGDAIPMFCKATAADHSMSPNRYPLLPEISLSIIVLADSITKAAFTITGEPLNMDWGTSGLLVDMMKQPGWYPSAIATLRKGQQIHNLYSASTLGPPFFKRDHPVCAAVLCRNDQVDETTYRTQHQ
jgi:hypothetical protein